MASSKKYIFLPLLATAAVAIEPRSSLRGSTKGLFPSNRKLDGEEFIIIPEPEDQCVDPVYLNENSATCCENPVIDNECLTPSSESTGEVAMIGGPNDDETSYFWINFDENAGAFAGLSIHAWCVDLSRPMTPGTHNFDIFSTYGDWNYDEALDSPELLPNVNWLINHHKIGEDVTTAPGYCGEEEATHQITWQTYQNTMWRIVDKGMTAEGIYSNAGAIECVVSYLVDEALANGDGYEPSCDDPDAEVGVILVVDDDNAENTIQKQVLFGEVPLSSLPCACKVEECCEELEVDHELFQENHEIGVTFTQNGEPGDGAAWDVQFSTGEHIFSGLSAEAWSVDLDRDLTDGDYMVDTYSAYDSLYRYNAIDKKENIPMVNWLINHLPAGSTIPDSEGCESSTVGINDFQNAIWDLVDHKGLDRLEGDACVQGWLVEMSMKYGEDYEPSCEGDSDSKIAVLLIIDEEGTEKMKANEAGTGLVVSDGQYNESVAKQILIAIIPLSDIDDSCKMKECPCCEYVPDEYCDEYNEIDFSTDDEGYPTGSTYVFTSSYTAYGMSLTAQRDGDESPIVAYYFESGNDEAGKVVIVPSDPTDPGASPPGGGMNPMGGDILINLDQTQGEGMKIDLFNIEIGATITAKDADSNVVGEPIVVPANEGVQSVRIEIEGAAQVVVSLEGIGGISMLHVCHDPNKTPAPFTDWGNPPTPSESPAEVIPIIPDNGGGGYGDPHLKTWRGRVYDFHGECDLLLTKSQSFGKGLGFEAQIRTTIRDDWSFISSIAVKIGQDVFEVQSGGVHLLNGVEDANLKASTLGGYEVKKHGGKKDNGTVKARYLINMREQGVLEVKVYNEFVSVLIRQVLAEDFQDSVGLMGTFEQGELVGRDLSTVFEDVNEFGFEWQVRDTDSMLFQESRFPQFPAKCTMPAIPSSDHRRLSEVAGGAGMIPQAEAEKACAHLPVEDRDACVYDVLTTGDLEMAELDGFE